MKYRLSVEDVVAMRKSMRHDLEFSLPQHLKLEGETDAMSVLSQLIESVSNDPTNLNPGFSFKSSKRTASIQFDADYRPPVSLDLGDKETIALLKKAYSENPQDDIFESIEEFLSLAIEAQRAARGLSSSDLATLSPNIQDAATYDEDNEEGMGEIWDPIRDEDFGR